VTHADRLLAPKAELAPTVFAVSLVILDLLKSPSGITRTGPPVSDT
jgi:hypothetical protein